jgi:hypothetical protein
MVILALKSGSQAWWSEDRLSFHQKAPFLFCHSFHLSLSLSMRLLQGHLFIDNETPVFFSASSGACLLITCPQVSPLCREPVSMLTLFGRSHGPWSFREQHRNKNE